MHEQMSCSVDEELRSRRPAVPDGPATAAVADCSMHGDWWRGWTSANLLWAYLFLWKIGSDMSPMDGCVCTLHTCAKFAE